MKTIFGKRSKIMILLDRFKFDLVCEKYVLIVIMEFLYIYIQEDSISMLVPIFFY